MYEIKAKIARMLSQAGTEALLYHVYEAITIGATQGMGYIDFTTRKQQFMNESFYESIRKKLMLLGYYVLDYNSQLQWNKNHLYPDRNFVITIAWGDDESRILDKFASRNNDNEN